MTKVLTSLCAVFSPINALSSRSNLISHSLNNCSCVIRSGLTKLPVDCTGNSTPTSCHGVKYNRLDNHSAKVWRIVWKNCVIFERASVKIYALKKKTKLSTLKLTKRPGINKLCSLLFCSLVFSAESKERWGEKSKGFEGHDGSGPFVCDDKENIEKWQRCKYKEQDHHPGD